MYFNNAISFVFILIHNWQYFFLFLSILTTQLIPNLWPWNWATWTFSSTSHTLTAGWWPLCNGKRNEKNLFIFNRIKDNILCYNHSKFSPTINIILIFWKYFFNFLNILMDATILEIHRLQMVWSSIVFLQEIHVQELNRLAKQFSCQITQHFPSCYTRLVNLPQERRTFLNFFLFFPCFSPTFG